MGVRWRVCRQCKYCNSPPSQLGVRTWPCYLPRGGYIRFLHQGSRVPENCPFVLEHLMETQGGIE